MASSVKPFQVLLQESHNDPILIRAAYENHRETRAGQQREIFLASEFEGVNIDKVLVRLQKEEEFKDERNGVVFSAKPTERVRGMIARVQDRLMEVIPSLWTTPPSQLHLTALEVTHSRPSSALPPILATLSPIIDKVTNYTLAHRTILSAPKITFDKTAIAISFLPVQEKEYTYHHLRSELYDIAQEAGVELGARYVVPSAHITIARFLDSFPPQAEFATRFIALIDSLNAELEQTDLIWKVGEEVGLDLRIGPNWYGGGETVQIGKGY